MAYQVGSVTVITDSRVLQNVTFDPNLDVGGDIVQTTFTSSGTFFKDAKDVIYMVEMWGGGSSGGVKMAFGQYGGESGGHGGAYRQMMILASDVSSTVAVTVGAGGQWSVTPSPPYYPNGTGPQKPGGDSSFGEYMRVGGGQRNGGGQGFVYDPSLGVTLNPYNFNFVQGAWAGGYFYPTDQYSTTNAIMGGAQGADNFGWPTSSTQPRRAGVSLYGGGGGGSSNQPAWPGPPIAIGGKSQFGGDGGDYPNGNGGARGGAGAQSNQPYTSPYANICRGGRGEVRITAWRS